MIIAFARERSEWEKSLPRTSSGVADRRDEGFFDHRFDQNQKGAKPNALRLPRT
jgi:hypothetical protein